MKRLLHLFNNCRLRTKLLISYVSLVVILLAFWSGSAYNQISRQLLENARSDFHNTFSFACLLLENKIARAERNMTLMAEDPSVSETFSTVYLSQFQQAQSLLDRLTPCWPTSTNRTNTCQRCGFIPITVSRAPAAT